MVLKRHFAAAPLKRGFTLIELMVATAIMALLVLAVMTVTSHVLTTWSSASGRLGANAEARTALQYLGDDLETLVVRPKRQVWLEVTYANMSLPGNKSINVPNISLITATEHRDRSNSDYGNICAVNYQVAFRHPITDAKTGVAPPPVAGLYRQVVTPKNTFDNVLATQFDPVTGEPLDLPSLHTLIGGNTTSFANFLSSNIVDLSVDFFAENLGTNSTDAPVVKVEGDFIYADKIYNHDGTLKNTNYGRLVYADIRMTVLSDDGAKALAAASISGQDVSDVIRQYGIVFSRRVPILSRY